MDASPGETGPADVGADVITVDSTPGDTGTGDTSVVMDGGPVDAGPTDSGSLDTGTPDTGTPTPTCASIYGAAPGYLECAERATECEFYTDLDGTYPSCDAMCGRFGGSCLRTYRESETSVANCKYYTGTERDCAAAHDDEICVCTR
jgi:hypothetical protein